MEVSGRRQTCSKEWDTGVPCDPCQIDNVSENGQLYCINCNGFLCDNCAIYHRKNKASRQHQLLDKDEMPRKKLSYFQARYCAKHDGKLLEYFCVTHDTFYCSVCKTLDHGQCDVKYIDDLAKGFISSQEYKSLLKQIKDIDKELTENKKKTQNDSFDVTNCFRRLITDIQVFRCEMNLKIDELEVDLMQQAEQIKEEDLKAVEFVDTLYYKLQLEMSEISSTLGLLEQCKQNQQLFISAKKAQTQVKEYNDKTQRMRQENSVRRYAFSCNEYILNALNSPRKLGSLEMKNEGDRKTTEREQTEKVLLKEDNPSIGTLSIIKRERRTMNREHTERGRVREVNPKISKLFIRRREDRKEEYATQNEAITMKIATSKSTQPKFVKRINIKHRMDINGCWITGSVLMSSDLLALADLYNTSITVVDLLSDTTKCYLELYASPWDITCIDPETLVVVCGKYLVFLHYDGKLSVVKKVPMESGCSGITYRKNKLFVTFDGKHPSVKILNHEGNVLQTFKHNDQGNNLFRCPRYIALNSDGDKMYVSDWTQNTVTSLSMDGRVCNIYTHDNLIRPAGLTLGDDDSIYVAGYRSNNIHQITTTCTSVRIVLEKKDGLICPWTVLYNNTDKTLYVSTNSSGRLFNVYKLE